MFGGRRSRPRAYRPVTDSRSRRTCGRCGQSLPANAGRATITLCLLEAVHRILVAGQPLGEELNGDAASQAHIHRA